MFLLYIKPEAETDILLSANWYEEQQKGLGLKFVNEVEDLPGYIETNPQLFPKKYKEVRQASLKKFPFVILFRIESKKIFIHAVFHCRQNPSRKKSRIK